MSRRFKLQPSQGVIEDVAVMDAVSDEVGLVARVEAEGARAEAETGVTQHGHRG